MIGSDRGRSDRLRDLVLAELLSTYTRSLGNALSMLDREHQTESAETWTRAGVRRQQIGVVESKSLDDSTSWAIGQARLPTAGRVLHHRRRMRLRRQGLPDTIGG